MFRLRSKSGDESVFRSPEEIRAALLSGIVTPDAQIWDAVLKGWVPLLEHALYQQIAAAPGGRKSGAVKGPPSGSSTAVPTPTPPGPKPIPKLVIKRPGEGATTAIPGQTPPVPPAQPPKAPTPPAPAADELPDIEFLDLELTPEVENPAPPPPVAKPPVAKVVPPQPTPPPPAPPKPSTPQPAAPKPAPELPPEPVSTARVSTSRMPEAPIQEEEEVASGGSKKGLIIGAVVLLAVAGVAFAIFGGKRGPAPMVEDTTTVTTPVAVAPIDTTHHDSTATTSDSTKRDSVTAPKGDSAKPAAAVVQTPPSTKHDSTPAAAARIAQVPFAPVVERGPTPWNARPVVGAPLSIPTLEVVRLRYLAAQAKALEQFEAGLQAAGFDDMFDPGRIGSDSRRNESLDAVDAGRSALKDFRRRQTAIDFAYTDSMRQAMPAGSETPDFRTFGPILRETSAQSALTDSLVGAVAEVYGMLVVETGGYTFRGGMLTWKDADNSVRYQGLQERLTAQIGRIRNRNPGDVPPAMAAVLRGIGLPR